jgi:hypothetical protein
MGFGWGAFGIGAAVGVIGDELFHRERQPQYQYGFSPMQEAGYYPLRPGPPGGYPPPGWGAPYAQGWNPGYQGFPSPEFAGRQNYEGAFGRPPMQGLGNPCEAEARNLVQQSLANPDPRCGGPNIQGILQALRNNERLDDADRASGIATEYTKDLYKAISNELYEQTGGRLSVRTYASAQGRVFAVNEGGAQGQANQWGQFQAPRTIAWGIINQPRHDAPPTNPPGTQDPDAPYPPPTG